MKTQQNGEAKEEKKAVKEKEETEDDNSDRVERQVHTYICIYGEMLMKREKGPPLLLHLHIYIYIILHLSLPLATCFKWKSLGENTVYIHI